MLKNKVIVVTGGAGLIGQEFIKAIIENNGVAIIADVDKVKSLEIKESITMETNRNNIDYINLDIVSRDSLIEAIKYLDDKYGKIDALVNNAYPKNKNYGRHFFDVSFEDFSENISNNLGGYFLSSQQFALYFKEQGYGNIVNIGSIYGVIPPRFEIYENTNMTTPVEYAAIKSGLLHLTKYMAKYFKGLNIRVNSLSPGGVFNHEDGVFIEKYKKHCLNKGMINTNDLKGSLVYLLSDMSQYVNGQNIIVDDGFSL